MICGTTNIFGSGMCPKRKQANGYYVRMSSFVQAYPDFGLTIPLNLLLFWIFNNLLLCHKIDELSKKRLLPLGSDGLLSSLRRAVKCEKKCKLGKKVGTTVCFNLTK